MKKFERLSNYIKLLILSLILINFRKIQLLDLIRLL